MRTIEFEPTDDTPWPEGFEMSDWKEVSDTFLKDLDDHLKSFGLEIVQVDSGGDAYLWKIEARSTTT